MYEINRVSFEGEFITVASYRYSRYDRRVLVNVRKLTATRDDRLLVAAVNHTAV